MDKRKVKKQYGLSPDSPYPILTLKTLIITVEAQDRAAPLCPASRRRFLV